jgi:hypothetical protein
MMLVLVESASPIIEASIKQLYGQYLPPAPIRVVLDHVVVSSMRAVQEMRGGGGASTSAGNDIKVMQLATELNCLFSMELLLGSQIIRDMVLTGRVELHAALMESETGKVRFLGEHPRQLEVIQAADLRAMVYKDGPYGILPRETW